MPAGISRFDVVIAGEINLDFILYGLPAQIPLEREILATGFMATLGSSSAIVAHNLSALGTSVSFICMAGRDPLGRIALDRVAESGADLSQVLFHPELSTGVTVLLPHADKRHTLTYPGAMAKMRVSDLPVDYMCSSRHLHLSSLFLQHALQPGLPELFRTLKRAGLTISMDTNDDPEDRWGGVLSELLDLVDVLLPNEDEILRMTRTAALNHALDSLASRVPLIVVKRGSAGAVLQQGKRREEIPGIPVIPVDTIGAGDSFNAGFLHAWLRGSDPVHAAMFGNVTGAFSTQRPGGTEAFRDRALLAQFLAAHAQWPGSPVSVGPSI